MSGADIAITITNASSPVLKGEWLAPGAHVNAAGSNHWLRREIDREAVARARVVVTDDVEQAKFECGDLIHPIERGVLRWRQVHELSEIVSGVAPGRTGPDDITLFESQGVALEDIATGVRLCRMARERGVGQEMPA